MMKALKTLITLFLLSATTCVGQQNPADQPATKADIDRYFDVMHMRELMRNMMDARSQQARQDIRKMVHDIAQKNPDLGPDFEEHTDKMCDGIFDSEMKDMPPDKLLDAMEPVYEKHLTKGEVDAIIAFYSTPIGQKIRAEIPAITQEAMQASSGMMLTFVKDSEEQIQDQINQMMKDYRAEPKKPAPSKN